MALSEIFDKGAPHQWADIRVNNIVYDGSFTLGTFFKTVTTKVTTLGTSVLPVTYLTIPVTNPNSCYYISISAIGYTNGVSLGFGTVSTNSQAFSYFGGALILSSPPTTTLPFNAKTGYFGYPPSAITPLGAFIVASASSIACQVVNAFPGGNTTSWLITTKIIGPVF